MRKLLKIKYIVIFMFALALITSVAAFSVSYAKWTGGADSIAAQGRTGEWSVGQQQITNGITYTDANGKMHTVEADSNDENSPFFNCESYLGGQFVLYVKACAEGQKFRLYIKGIDFENGNVHVILNTDSENVLKFASGEFTVEKLMNSAQYFCFNIARNPEDNSVIILVYSTPSNPDRFVELGV